MAYNIQLPDTKDENVETLNRILSQNPGYLEPALASNYSRELVKEYVLKKYVPIEPNLKPLFDIEKATDGVIMYFKNWFEAETWLGDNYTSLTLMGEATEMIRKACPLTSSHPISAEGIEEAQKFIIGELTTYDHGDIGNRIKGKTLMPGPDEFQRLCEVAHTTNIFNDGLNFIHQYLPEIVAHWYNEKLTNQALPSPKSADLDNNLLI